jgi:putative component of toxin-antitoxin plasmid stabilization module
LYLTGYIMFEVQKTDEFDGWLSGLADQKAQAKIASRIERLGFGNPGDVKPVGEGVSEMRVPMARAIAFTTSKPARPSFFSCAVETSPRRRKISNERKK